MLEEGEVEEDEDDLETGGDLSDDPSTLPEDEPNFVPNQASSIHYSNQMSVNKLIGIQSTA